MIRSRKLKAVMACCCLLSTLFLYSQQGIIKGKITGMEEGTLPTVSLLKMADSSLVKTTIADKAGYYEFEQIQPGKYLVTASHVGYNRQTSGAVEISEGQMVIQVPDLVLMKGEKELAGVVVTGRKPFVQRKIDRVVINPDALIGNAGATSLEMLEKAPGVLVDMNGNISLKGKQGVIVFIDDKPTYMAAADLANYLRSLPASAVESIEIMTNPPARYDASGNAGIINIKMKRTVVRGVSGGINLGYGQGRYLRSNNSANVNYRINRINLFANLGWSQNNSYQDLTIHRYYYEPSGAYSSGFSQNSYINRRQRGQTARLGMDYYINNKITTGIVLAGFINPSSSTVTNTAVILDQSNNVTGRVAAFNPTDRKWKNGSVNINSSYKIDGKGKEIIMNADYIRYSSTSDQTLINSLLNPDYSPVSSSTLFSTLPARIAIKTISADYTNPLKQGGKIDVGVKASFVHTDNTASFFDVDGSVRTPNYEFSNRFRYKENINAVYANYSREWKKFSVQAGLRMENTNIDGYQFGNPVTDDSGFVRRYTNFFPTLYLAYRLDTLQKHQFGFSAGRRINRPNYQDMNPFTYPLDRYTYYAGNPFLQPTFSYNVELNYTFNNKVTLSADYGIANDLIQETNEQRNTIFYSRPGNFGRQTSYGIDLNGSFKIAKWWTLQLYTEYKNLGYKSTIYGQTLDEDHWYWYLGPNNQFTINPDFSLELAGSYQSRILVGQFLTIPVWQMRFGASHRILKGKGSVRFNVTDIFYTNQPGGDIRNINNAKANWLSYLDSRVASISFSYRFNKGKALNARQSGASETEKGRIRTN